MRLREIQGAVEINTGFFVILRLFVNFWFSNFTKQVRGNTSSAPLVRFWFRQEEKFKPKGAHAWDSSFGANQQVLPPNFFLIRLVMLPFIWCQTSQWFLYDCTNTWSCFYESFSGMSFWCESSDQLQFPSGSGQAMEVASPGWCCCYAVWGSMNLSRFVKDPSMLELTEGAWQIPVFVSLDPILMPRQRDKLQVEYYSPTDFLLQQWKPVLKRCIMWTSQWHIVRLIHFWSSSLVPFRCQHLCTWI